MPFRLERDLEQKGEAQQAACSTSNVHVLVCTVLSLLPWCPTNLEFKSKLQPRNRSGIQEQAKAQKEIQIAREKLQLELQMVEKQKRGEAQRHSFFSIFSVVGLLVQHVGRKRKSENIRSVKIC